MFTTNIKVRFNHIDGAGIIFYPRYYEMFNQVVEEWCESTLGYDFHTLNQELNGNLPSVHIDADFPKTTRLGEIITFKLKVVDLGRSSLKLNLKGAVNDEHRVEANMTLVYTEKSSQGEFSSAAIPDELRQKILAQTKSQ